MDLRKDIFFYADLASFPASGAVNELYVDKSTGLIYSWSGSAYVAAGAGGLKYSGLWNANTNSPAITSGVGNAGEYYIVGTAGTTNIDGISDWGLGDWIIFGTTAWQKIDNSDQVGVVSVSGSAPISSSGGTTPTISIAKASGSADGYLSSTDWTTFNNKLSSNIYTSNGTVTGNRTIDLNGNTLRFSNGPVEFDQGSTNSGEIRLYEDSDFGSNKVTLRAAQAMSSDTSLFFPPTMGSNGYVLTTDGAGNTAWSANGNGTVTSVSALTLGTSGTDLSSTVANGTTTPTITLNVPTASATNRGALSSTDWSTFNGKQNAITLTTTGTSGAATLVGSTLNIPQYAGGLSYFTEAQNTSAPNGTVYVDSLTAAASSTNADFAIVAKGTGAIIANVPDNTVTNGNKRGQYAVDWQRVRGTADRVASGDYSTIIGGYNNIANSAGAIAGGYNAVASNGYSVSLGLTNTAGGLYSTAIGSGNAATQQNSVALGGNNTASGAYSFVVGVNGVASGTFASSIGNENLASGGSSFAHGTYSNAFSVYGRKVYASGRESTTGDAQASKFILRKRTTGNTATTLTTDSGSASTDNQVILSNNSAYRFKGSIIGKKSGSTDVAAWDIDGLIVRGANAAATTLSISNVNVVQNTPAWGTPTLAADTGNGGLKIQVTGLSATNIQWTCTVETTEVIYA